MIVSPLHGDDFNDDLRRGATAGNYAVMIPRAAPLLMTAADFESAARALTKPPELHALGAMLGQLVTARLEPLPERQVLSSVKVATGIPVAVSKSRSASCAAV
ncbi:MAG: hypothetical protein ACRET4_00950 [Steroidobacteraceae bacterium]